MKLLFQIARTDMSSNPYEPVRQIQHTVAPIPANYHSWAIVGFLVAFLPLAAAGAFGLYNEARYAATLPPNSARCGSGAMGAMLVIFPISPTFGLIGSGIGFVSALLYNALILSGLRTNDKE